MKSKELGDWTDRPVAWPHATPSASSTETLAYRPFSALAQTDAKPLNRPRLRAGGSSFPGPLPAVMFVAGIWSIGSYLSSLGYAKAGPRSGAGTGN